MNKSSSSQFIVPIITAVTRCRVLTSKKSLLLIYVYYFVAITANAQNAFKVDVVYPEQQLKKQFIRLPGTVETSQQAQLASLESGRVDDLQVEVGDVVNKGAVLLKLNSQLIQLEIQGAQADVQVAELNHQEAERLYQEVQKLSVQKVVAKTLIAERAAMLANREAQLVRSKASLNLLKERLNRHSLTAPFDGIIAHRNIEIGEWITPQNAALTLVSQNNLRLAVQIPQQHYSQLSAHLDTGIAVHIIPDALGADPFSAKLSRLVPVSDSNTRTFAALIDFPNEHTSIGSKFVTGMSAIAEMTLPGNEQNTVILPRTAIKQHPDGNSSLFVVQNNTAKRVITDYEIIANDRVAVHNQPPGQGYIVTGVELLNDGSPVTVNVIKSTD